MTPRGEHLILNGAPIILAELFGVLALRRSEFFASAEKSPNLITLLYFRSLTGTALDFGDSTRFNDIPSYVDSLSLLKIVKVRLRYTKHQRHRVAHDVVAGSSYKVMSSILWLKVVVKLRRLVAST